MKNHEDTKTRRKAHRSMQNTEKSAGNGRTRAKLKALRAFESSWLFTVSWSFVLPDEHGGRDDRGPERFLVADGSLGYVLSADDLVREAIDLFVFVPALVGVEFEAEGRREHFGGEFFSVVAGSI